MLIKNVKQRKSKQYPLYYNLQFDDENGNHYDWLIRSRFFNSKLVFLSVAVPFRCNFSTFIHNHKWYLLCNNELLELDKVLELETYGSIATASKYVEVLRYRMMISKSLTNRYGIVSADTSGLKVALYDSNWCDTNNIITIPLNDEGYKKAIELGICISTNPKVTVRSLERYLGGEIV